MTATGPFSGAVGLALCVAATCGCYRFAVSPAVRDLSHQLAAKRDLRPATWAVTAVAVAAPALGTSPSPGSLRWCTLFVLAALTWRFATTDYDQTQPLGPQRRAGCLLLACAAGVALWPPLLLCWLALACGRLRGWQHHPMLALRLLKAYLAWFFAAFLLNGALAESLLQDGLLLVLCCVALSHYLKAAESKLRLGPHWWSWAWRNRTHCLIASAYSWGWARFLSPPTAVRVLRAAAPLNRPLNIATMLLELSPLVAFADRWALVAALAATVLFNVVVVLASGIFFWENIAANAALAITVAAWPRALFGLSALPLALPVLVAAVAGWVWQPWPLGWWDTPFTARVRWEVRTASGRRLGLYNGFMCPYERDFGRVLGYFLTREPVVHGHLGTVFDHHLRDRILTADADPSTLSGIKRDDGHVHADATLARKHLDYLSATFTALNSGASKGPLPRRLRWLKAPGGQLFRWGDLPSYRGEEPVTEISIHYEERYYRSAVGEFVTLTDRLLHRLDIPLSVPRPARSADEKNPR
ncbi:hypothetical protein KBY17_22000 [Streptomyces sp. RK75]|nr:hypothetical protein [Streptomyces sp. RK75]